MFVASDDATWKITTQEKNLLHQYRCHVLLFSALQTHPEQTKILLDLGLPQNEIIIFLPLAKFIKEAKMTKIIKDNQIFYYY